MRAAELQTGDVILIKDACRVLDRTPQRCADRVLLTFGRGDQVTLAPDDIVVLVGDPNVP